MHQNIKQNYTRSIDARLYNEKYYDFMLHMGEVSHLSQFDLDGMALADFSDLYIEDGILYSTVNWSGATNSGVEMNDIGMTGVDNGLIIFQKDRITNEEFLDIYFNSKYVIESGDTRLFLTPVTGNTQRYSYPMYLIDDDDSEKYIAFRGGFYQGFFKLDGFDYQVLPTSIGGDTFLHFDLRPRTDVDDDVDSMNFMHPENKGIFFYMGTRAENKFWPFYKYNKDDFAGFKKTDAQSEGYFDGCGEESGETFNINDNRVVLLEGEWIREEEKEIEESYFAVGDGYYALNGEECSEKLKKNHSQFISEKSTVFGQNYLNTYDYHPDNYCGCSPSDSSSPCYTGKPSYDECNKCCADYFVDDYYDDQCPEYDNGKAIDENAISKGVAISENGEGYYDSFGHEFNKNGHYDIETDNKFLMFDRTEDGFTTHTWVEGTKVTLTGRKSWPNANYFLLMNRTPTGYTASNIESYNEENGYDFNIYKDIRNNVFALRVTESGAIGYRLGILDCNEESENRYKLMEEYSKDGIIKNNEWNSVNVRFVTLGEDKEKCGKSSGLMKIMIYVNGFLVFISKELPNINFKRLDEVSEKQQAVPYNISLGGGSQGLMETIVPNYYAITDYVLPIERDFCGSFIGDIKSFKMFKGLIDYSAIRNYLS